MATPLNLWAIKATEVSLEISLKATMRDGMSDESMGLAGGKAAFRHVCHNLALWANVSGRDSGGEDMVFCP